MVTRWYSNKLQVRKIDDNTVGDLMTMEEFIDAVESRCLIDYDGFGYYATPDLETNIMVKPSDLKRREMFTETYSHVVWYNR